MVEVALRALPRAGIFGWVPGVEVRVEVDDCHRRVVDLVQRAQSRQGDTVVSAEREELRVWVRRVRECWGAGAKGGERRGHLGESEGVIERGDGDVAAIQNRERRGVWIQAASRIETSEGGLAR